MTHEFRFIGERADSGQWNLLPDESHHALKVLRLANGTPIEITNGQGMWAQGPLQTDGKRAWCCTACEHHDPLPKQAFHVAIGALAHGDLDEILPALVELGVDGIHVFQQPGVDRSRLSDKAVLRWQRIISGAVKQCKRSRIPAISTHPTIEALLAHGVDLNVSPLVFRDGAAMKALSITLDGSGFLAIIGSERGFDPAEEAFLDQRLVPAVQLGSHVLRAKTAAIAACAVLGQRLER